MSVNNVKEVTRRVMELRNAGSLRKPADGPKCVDYVRSEHLIDDLKLKQLEKGE